MGWTGRLALTSAAALVAAALAPGIATMMLASVVSTFTDPLTWRAVVDTVLSAVELTLDLGSTPAGRCETLQLHELEFRS